MSLAAPARVTVPVAASAALGPLLARPAEGAILGAGESGAWARLGDTVVVLLPPGVPRAPHGVVVPPTLLVGLEPGTACRVDAGRFEVAGWRLEVRASWDPRPRLPRVDATVLREWAREVSSRFVPAADQGMGAALGAHDVGGVLAAASRLIGRGPGLTPLGDDLLAGTMGAAVLLGEAAGDRWLLSLAADLAEPLDSLARERTTALSTTLLRHARRGEVDDASAALLQALCGRGDAAAALAALLEVGHSSGTGLAGGILAAAACAGGAE
ncbi:MAG: DUF2877 domain-containing protein [Acidimicrobiia bacterium]|nr:DUF2877 domain-containing protein [Acidimicrobiia bacterium]